MCVWGLCFRLIVGIERKTNLIHACSAILLIDKSKIHSETGIVVQKFFEKKKLIFASLGWIDVERKKERKKEREIKSKRKNYY